MSQAQSRADMILHNANVLTVNADFDRAEAVAIAGEHILAVGSNDEILKLKGPDTKVVDVEGATVMPGINDAHIHVMPLGFFMTEINLNGMPLEAARQSIKERAAAMPKGEIIRGTGYTEPDFGRLPTVSDFDDIAPDHPVILIERSHHQIACNTKALELLGVTDDQADADGLTFMRDADGKLTGVIQEGYLLVQKTLPPPPLEEQMAAIQRAVGLLNSMGVTSVTEPGLKPEELEPYLRLAESGALNARACVHIWGNEGLDAMRDVLSNMPDTKSPKGKGACTGNLTIRGIKLTLDGAPPALTAATFDEYEGHPGVTGEFVFKGETQEEMLAEIYRTIDGLHQDGYQIAIHATGDRSAFVGIDALSKAITDHPLDGTEKNPLRHYMIHGDRVRVQDMHVMAEHDIMLNINPQITHYAGEAVIELWGQEHGERHMALKLFQDAGVKLSIGTDCPVVPPTWMDGLKFAATRQGVSGRYTGKQYAISMQDAVIAHTRDAAYQDHQDDVKGTLEAGKLADIAVFDQSFVDIDPAKVPETRALMTIVGGKVVHDAMPA